MVLVLDIPYIMEKLRKTGKFSRFVNMEMKYNFTILHNIS